MKLILMSLVSALMATTALAMPKVGDVVNYNFTISQQGQNTNGTVKQTITTFVNGMYNVETTYEANGQTQVQNNQRKPENMIDDATINAVLSNCAAYNGKLETVTVPAGTFNTCSIPNNENNQKGDIWFGAVPFGVVKMISTNANGRQTYMELTSFQFGKQGILERVREN